MCKNIYYRIVGDDDGGELFTPEQYEEYKKNVVPMVCMLLLPVCVYKLFSANSSF